MNIDSKELEHETKHLEETIKIINEVIGEKNINIEEYKKSIVEEKKYIWQNKHEFKDTELYNSMDDSDLNTSLVNNDIKKVYRLYRSLEAPYFSRIDFKTNNEEETFYIGLTGVEKNYDIIVYDWRASIANLYYNYGIGESLYETPEGKVLGETTLKRNFQFKRGELTSVYDCTSGVSDVILESILKNNTSDVMKNIVGTIGKEQNEIIRYPNTHLIVEGVAGSGKTSVALHRLAYLLYNQKNLNYKNTLIFSPSEIFSHYISNVLPELGEENVATTTFNDFASSYIKNVKIEPLTEFIERYYENPEYKIDDKIKFKLSKDYKKKIDNYLEEYFNALKFDKKVGLKKKELTAHDLNELKNKVPYNLKFYDKLQYLSEKIVAYFELDEEKNKEKFYSLLVKLLKIDKDPLKLYEKFSGEEIGDKVFYEDICGILYLYFEIVGYPSFSLVKCVVIDEAQDYSSWQFEFIKSIFNAAKFTILGDVNQAINPYLKHNSLRDIEYIFDTVHYRKLAYSYRSSREIIEFANSILGLENTSIIRDNFGLPVQFLEERNIKSDIENCIQKFFDFGLEKIAVITKTASEAEKIKSLGIENLEVLPVYISKGLEYDGVIVYTDINNAFNEDEKNIFYVAVTRALHGLALINQKK